MIWFTIEHEQLDKMILDVRAFIADLENRTELMQDIKEKQVERWNAHITNQGAEYGGWEPTSASYKRQRVREGFSAEPTLDRSGRTILHVIDMNERGEVSNSAIDWNFENNVAGRAGQYPVSHHTGYTLGKSQVPARTIWDLDEKDADRGEQEVDEWLGGLIATHFG